MASTPTGHGYWLTASDGGIFSYGDADYGGSGTLVAPPAPIVAIEADATPALYVHGQRGFDISWPNCRHDYPIRPFEVAVVGVNNGRAFTTNPCLVDEATRWATPDQLDVYLNLNRPPSTYTPTACSPGDAACTATAFGADAARSSIGTVNDAHLAPRIWWLDIETANSWDSDTTMNARTIQAAVDALHAAGLVAGVYSTKYQWGVITGNFITTSPLELWAPGTTAYQRCAEPFAGGRVVLSQVLGSYSSSGFDEDYAC